MWLAILTVIIVITGISCVPLAVKTYDVGHPKHSSPVGHSPSVNSELCAYVVDHTTGPWAFTSVLHLHVVALLAG